MRGVLVVARVRSLREGGFRCRPVVGAFDTGFFFFLLLSCVALGDIQFCLTFEFDSLGAALGWMLNPYSTE